MLISSVGANDIATMKENGRAAAVQCQAVYQIDTNALAKVAIGQLQNILDRMRKRRRGNKSG